MKLKILLLAAAILFSGTVTAVQAQSSHAERLALTGKVWGYLKYHHTGTCSTDWDLALITNLDAQSESDTDQAFNSLLSDLIAAAGINQPPNTELPEIDDIYRIPADKGWMQDPLLSEQNRLSIQMIEDGFRPFQSCYITTGMVDEPSFAPDDQYHEELNPEISQRLLAMFRFWNIINYFSPYKGLIDEDWEEVLIRYVGRMLLAPDIQAYHLLMREFTAEIDDTHGFMVSSVMDEYLGQIYTPFRVELIEGKTIVTRAVEGASPEVGDEILTLDGQNVDQRRVELAPYIAASNPIARAFVASRYLERGSKDSVIVEFRRNDVTMNAAVNLSAENGQFIYEERGPTWRKYDLGQCQLGYINMDLLETGDVHSVMNQFDDTDGIVFDIRNYPNGTLWWLVNYLYPGPIDVAHFHLPKLDYPATTEGLFGTIGEGDSTPYDGRLLILFDEKAISQSEYTVMGLEQHPGAVKIGSQTSAADGNVTQIFLPGDITVFMTGLGVYYPDGAPTQRIGMVPDLYLTPTVNGIRDGVDEVLETALDCGHVLDPDWPADPEPKSALYYDPEYNGHGFDLSRVGQKYIVVNYTYRQDASPVWYLATGNSQQGVFELDETGYASYTYDYGNGSTSRHLIEPASFTLDYKAGQQQIGCAIDNPSSRESPASLDWQQEDLTTRWCPELYRFDNAAPIRNIGGLWYAGETDRGWGVTIRLQGQTLVVVLYFYDQSGQPVWAIASGQVSSSWPEDGPVALDLNEARGYCFSCGKQAIETRIIGRIELSLSDASRSFLDDNWISIEALAGDDEQPWVRDHTPLVILSDPE
jgi:carboxyl-terminal processing protease